MLGLKILCVCGSRGGVWNVTFVALAWLWGGTFSFCDRQRTDDLPVSSGGKNWKSRHCELFSLGTFSSFKTCRLILTTVAKPWARADAHRKGGAPCPLRAKKTEHSQQPNACNPQSHQFTMLRHTQNRLRTSIFHSTLSQLLGKWTAMTTDITVLTGQGPRTGFLTKWFY